MKRLRHIALSLALTASLAVGAASIWEPTGQPLNAQTLERIDDSGVDINVRDGVVTITVARPTQVKVFSILGQLISQETLPAGIHRLKLRSRGIYILRAGQLTRRITL